MVWSALLQYCHCSSGECGQGDVELLAMAPNAKWDLLLLDKSQWDRHVLSAIGLAEQQQLKTQWHGGLLPVIKLLGSIWEEKIRHTDWRKSHDKICSWSAERQRQTLTVLLVSIYLGQKVIFLYFLRHLWLIVGQWPLLASSHLPLPVKSKHKATQLRKIICHCHCQSGKEKTFS